MFCCVFSILLPASQLRSTTHEENSVGASEFVGDNLLAVELILIFVFAMKLTNMLLTAINNFSTELSRCVLCESIRY